MEHADRFLRRFYIEKGMFGSLSVTFIFYRPPLLFLLLRIRVCLYKHFCKSRQLHLHYKLFFGRELF